MEAAYLVPEEDHPCQYVGEDPYEGDQAQSDTLEKNFIVYGFSQILAT